MFSLAFTYATHNPALLVIRSKGYEVTISRDEPGGRSTYIASAPGRRFAATSGAELLGLVTIWEHYGEKWNIQEPDIIDEILERVEPDE